jgi:hypothetical protein
VPPKAENTEAKTQGFSPTERGPSGSYNTNPNQFRLGAARICKRQYLRYWMHKTSLNVNILLLCKAPVPERDRNIKVENVSTKATFLLITLKYLENKKLLLAIQLLIIRRLFGKWRTFVHTTRAGVSFYQISRLVCSVECSEKLKKKLFLPDLIHPSITLSLTSLSPIITYSGNKPAAPDYER